MNTPSRTGAFFSQNRPVLAFFAAFAGLFVILMTLHYFTRFYTAYFVITKLNAGTSSLIINIITPSEHTVVEGQIIRSGPFSLSVARGCEGMDGIILITAALLAYPMTWRRKVPGIVLGMLTLYAANLARIINLYYVGRYHAQWFDLMHIYIWQTLTIFIGLIFFAWWTGRPDADRADP